MRASVVFFLRKQGTTHQVEVHNLVDDLAVRCLRGHNLAANAQAADGHAVVFRGRSRVGDICPSDDDRLPSDRAADLDVNHLDGGLADRMGALVEARRVPLHPRLQRLLAVDRVDVDEERAAHQDVQQPQED